MRLSSAVSLDYETVSLYHLVVTVSDGVNTDISATLTVTINDLFDLDPEILNLQDAVHTEPVTVELAEMTATPRDIFLVSSHKVRCGKVEKTSVTPFSSDCEKLVIV